MLSRQQIRDLCAACAGDAWWVEPGIPANRLANAREVWRQPPGDVIAFADATALRSGKEGLAVTPEGLVWEGGAYNQAGRCSYGWAELAGVPIRTCGRLLQIGSGALFTGAIPGDADPLVTCLRQLQQAARAAGAALAPAHVPEGRAFAAAGQPPAGAAELQSLLESLAGDWLHLAPNIPERKARNAREALRIPADEGLLALADTTVFRSGKDGLAIATRGIYWNNSFLHGGNENGRLTWEALARTRVMLASGLVMLGGNDWIKPDSGKDAETERLVLGVQWWARARMGPEQRQAALAAAGEQEPQLVLAPVLDDDPRWHLAVDGQSFGPYDTTRIGLMAAAGQVDPDTAHAWTEGMPAWMPLRQVPQLAAVLPSAPPPAPVAPPAPAPAPGTAPSADPHPTLRPATEQARIDVNHAPLEDLLLLPGVDRARAERIVQERAARGGFGDADQLGQALGLRPHQLARMKGMATFGRVAAARGRLVDF